MFGPLLAHTSARALLAALLIAPTAAMARPPAAPTQQEVRIERPRIQLAILLDTSNSMDGLIDQARQQLWQAVSEFAKAKREGVSPVLEVAVYEYGNSRLDPGQGYTRQVLGLTRELDQVSEALFSLTTSGGDEFCGYAIDTAVHGLQWSGSPNDVRAIFIAGNEPFTQGPRPFTEAIAEAKRRGIVVNAIHAGDYQTGLNQGWQKAALLAGGNYMSIDHEQAVVHVQAPQDEELAQLNAELNQTYVPYGKAGAAGAARQREQDSKSAGVSSALLAKRAQAKATTFYDNSRWDLVDAVESGAAEIETLEPEAMPAPLQAMDVEARKSYLADKAKARAGLKARIKQLSKERAAYVAAQRKSESEQSATLEDALTESVRKQAQAKRFEFATE